MVIIPVYVLRLGHKKHCGFHLGTLPWVTHHGGIHHHITRNLCGNELRPPANSRVCAPFWKWILQPPSSLQKTAAPAHFIRALEPEPPCCASPECLTLRNCVR